MRGNFRHALKTINSSSECYVNSVPVTSGGAQHLRSSALGLHNNVAAMRARRGQPFLI